MLPTHAQAKLELARIKERSAGAVGEGALHTAETKASHYLTEASAG
jgi:hypothetical protein